MVDQFTLALGNHICANSLFKTTGIFMWCKFHSQQPLNGYIRGPTL